MKVYVTIAMLLFVSLYVSGQTKLYGPTGIYSFTFNNNGRFNFEYIEGDTGSGYWEKINEDYLIQIEDKWDTLHRSESGWLLHDIELTSDVKHAKGAVRISDFTNHTFEWKSNTRDFTDTIVFKSDSTYYSHFNKQILDYQLVLFENRTYFVIYGYMSDRPLYSLITMSDKKKMHLSYFDKKDRVYMESVLLKL